MIHENEKKNREELLRLIRENPELQIVPMVDGEIPCDACGYWLGALGNVRVDEYIISEEYDGQILFKSNDDVFSTLKTYLNHEEFKALPKTEEECRPYYDKLPWIKAIIVYIDAL